MNKILFRVEAGEGAGLGHLQRCLSLALALKELGHESVFAVTGGRESQARVELQGFEVASIVDGHSGSGEDLSLVIGAATSYECVALVTDSYQINSSYHAALRASHFVVVAIDDLAEPPFTANLIVNGGVQDLSLSYREAVEGSSCLLGPQYAMLEKEYSDIPIREVESIERILITMGGADSEGLTSRIITALDLLREEFDLKIIVGPFNLHEQAITEAVRQSRRQVDIQHSPASLHQSILSTQLAISAAGQTLYELAATGTPAIAVQTAENQVLNITAFADRGCILQAAPSRQGSVEGAVLRQVSFLIANPVERKAMSIAGRKLVDGQGSFRVAKAISQSISEGKLE